MEIHSTGEASGQVPGRAKELGRILCHGMMTVSYRVLFHMDPSLGNNCDPYLWFIALNFLDRTFWLR